MIVDKTRNMTNRKVDKSILLQRKLYLAAKANPKRCFGALYDKVYRSDVLTMAYKRIKANRGAPGVDRRTFDDIEKVGVDKFLKGIQQELMEGKYKPKPVLRKYIPKSGGKLRPLGIPTIKDRVVQMATKIAIEPLFEADFQDFSYGFRPKRSAHQAIKEVRKYINFGCQEVIEVDLKSFFDTIPHDKLMKLVKRRVSDPKVLKLIKSWLIVGTVSEKGHARSVIGTPQGGVISPLLANVFLNELDRQWRERGYDHRSKDAHLIRYADDMVVVCKWRPKFYFDRLKEILDELGVEMNQDKTKVVHATKGFDFLGISFRLARSDRGKMNCYYWPSHKARNNFRQLMRNMLNIRCNLTMPRMIEAVNPVIRGWGQYFALTNSAEIMWELDRYVWMRINNVVKRARKVRGVRRGEIPAKALYTQHGLVSLYDLTKQIRRKL